MGRSGYSHFVVMTTSPQRRAGPPPRPLDVDQARISRSRDRSVLFDDPGSPWIVRVWVGTTHRRRYRRYISRIRIDVRPGGPPITAARLASLPAGQLLHVAAAQLATALPDGHPNEAWYRMLASPKPRGSRSWPVEHWDRVLEVHRWAEDTQRPGGGARAVADLWGVAVNPTAYRWLGYARRRSTDNQEGQG